MDAVIAYTSRSLTKAKSHYPAHKLEFVALKWAVVEKFHKYLYGWTFDVYMDNNPLTYVLIMAKLDTASHQGWPAWPITTFSCIIGWGRPTSTQMPCQGCPGQSAFLILWTLISRSLLWQCKPCRRPPSKAPGVPLKHIVVICMSWTLLKTVCRSLARTIDDWHQAQQGDLVLSLVITRLPNLWANASSNQLIFLNFDSSFGSTTTSS